MSNTRQVFYFKIKMIKYNTGFILKNVLIIIKMEEKLLIKKLMMH